VILLNARAGVAEKARVLVGRTRREDREGKEESGRMMNDMFGFRFPLWFSFFFPPFFSFMA
jgi:hypothetical protein